MKKCLSSMLLLFFVLCSQAQTVSFEDFKTLIPFLQKEDWKNVYEKSEKLLLSSVKDTSDFRAITLYANILSAAGMVTEKSMSFNEIKKNLSRYEGQKIIFASHPITKRDGDLNSVKFSDDLSSKEAFITATNKAGINILCFEKITFNTTVNPEEFGKSFVRCGGTLEKIEFNPNQSLIWITRLTVKNGFANKVD